MSATIMMPQAIDSAIREMCADAMTQAVAALAAKYGFDADEAGRFLSTEEIKLVRKRGPISKGDVEKSVTKTKTSKGKKSDSDEEKPKRAPTGYLLFGKEMRSQVKTHLLEELPKDQKLTPQAVVVELAARWQALGDGGKAEWNTKAKTPDVSGESEPEPEEEPDQEMTPEPEVEEEPEEPVAKPVKEKKKKDKKKKEKVKVESDSE